MQIIGENPYMQFLIGLSGYKAEKPFDSSSLTNFRKRLTEGMITEINEIIISEHEASAEETEDDDDNNSDNEEPPQNKGTLMSEATCAPSNIKYSQDTND